MTAHDIRIGLREIILEIWLQTQISHLLDEKFLNNLIMRSKELKSLHEENSKGESIWMILLQTSKLLIQRVLIRNRLLQKQESKSSLTLAQVMKMIPSQFCHEKSPFPSQLRKSLINFQMFKIKHEIKLQRKLEKGNHNKVTLPNFKPNDHP